MAVAIGLSPSQLPLLFPKANPCKSVQIRVKGFCRCLYDTIPETSETPRHDD
jgi:hypothetical protein